MQLLAIVKSEHIAASPAGSNAYLVGAQDDRAAPTSGPVRRIHLAIEVVSRLLIFMGRSAVMEGREWGREWREVNPVHPPLWRKGDARRLVAVPRRSDLRTATLASMNMRRFY
jgi:hypothetical protein